MRRAGSASPEAISAERTRSRASDTALSARPTTANAGSPGATCTLHVDGAGLDALERYRGDPLDHAPEPQPLPVSVVQKVTESDFVRKNICRTKRLSLTFPSARMEMIMVDLKALQMELAFARRARREAQMAGLDIERVIAGMQAGRTLQQIELEEAAALDAFVEVEALRQAA
jgi:hypothetical protein